MKKLIFIFLLFSTFTNAQKIIPYAGVEYFIDYTYAYIQPIDALSFVQYNSLSNNKPKLPTFNVVMGFKFRPIRNLTLNIRTEALTVHVKGLSFTPIQTDYYAVLSYQYKEIKLSYSHLCTHPTKLVNKEYFQMFGGYDKISIFWQLKAPDWDGRR